jgi:hypothetical protein
MRKILIENSFRIAAPNILEVQTKRIIDIIKRKDDRD